MHHYSTAQVWRTILDSGVPYHWWYDSAPGRGDRAGARRLSCSLCVLGSRHECVLAARRRPRLAALYHEVEQRTGHRFKLDLPMSRVLELAAVPGGPEPGIVLQEQHPEFDALVDRVRAPRPAGTPPGQHRPHRRPGRSVLHRMRLTPPAAAFPGAREIPKRPEKPPKTRAETNPEPIRSPDQFRKI
ncbi:hypothetical protein [Amycolatopsis rubida]|uniref:Phosphoadenosine phosphosulfate reductase family protein n=1 Tax=Amycolatopsis rubida TaxID=112413 RepID=A0A1I5XIW0_9PSEU|nr:hypothetical protein [Amycolatopsis rubida]SFQ31898.1 hypothetical protein SAMN05421854_110266 [Amycolatopsis rubida]